MFLVSACLCGMNTKYDGTNNFNQKIFDLVKDGKAIAVCPEQLGGLTTPRVPSEIKNGKVINKNGIDVTDNFINGANQVLDLVKKFNIDKVILKSKSPSCGKGKIYSGYFNGELVDGNGILTQLLLDNNVEVISSDDIDKYI